MTRRKEKKKFKKFKKWLNESDSGKLFNEIVLAGSEARAHALIKMSKFKFLEWKEIPYTPSLSDSIMKASDERYRKIK